MTDAKKRPSGKKLAAFVVATVLLVLLIAFGVGEAYFRIGAEPFDLMMWTGRKAMTGGMEEWAYLDAFSAYKPIPGFKLAEGKSVSPEGFVSTPHITTAKRPGEFRIAFLGESSTAGTGWNLKDEETWPYQAVQFLRKRYPGADITFINAAVGGYSSFESYGRLVNRVRFYKPDVVVMNHGWNDMYYFSHAKMKEIEKWRTLPDGSWSLKSDVKIKTWEPMWFDDFIQYSQLLSRFRIYLSPDPNEEAAVVRENTADNYFDTDAVEVFRSNLKLIRESAGIFGAELFVCKQATMITPGMDDPQMEMTTNNLHGFGVAVHVRAYGMIYRVIEEEIVPDRIIDLTPLSGRSGAFFDHVHPRPDGAIIMGNIVAGAIEKYIEEKGLFRTETPQ